MVGSMMTTKMTTAATYTSAGVTVYFGQFTLNEIGIIVGVVATAITLAMNAWFQWRRDQREEAAHKKQLGG